jgi:hypothetical protein
LNSMSIVAFFAKALAAYQFSVGLDVFVCMRKNSCVLELILATNLPHFCS